jgi:hypothetical protein
MKRFGINNSEAIPPVIANTDINTSLDDTKQVTKETTINNINSI